MAEIAARRMPSRRSSRPRSRAPEGVIVRLLEIIRRLRPHKARSSVFPAIVRVSDVIDWRQNRRGAIQDRFVFAGRGIEECVDRFAGFRPRRSRGSAPVRCRRIAAPPRRRREEQEGSERTIDMRRKRERGRVGLAQRYSLALGSWLLALGSWLLALGSWLLALGSWLALGSSLALGSWLLALGSWLLALGSWLFGSWLLALGSWLWLLALALALGSWLLALGSWLLALGSWLLALGSWLLALMILCADLPSHCQAL